MAPVLAALAYPEIDPVALHLGLIAIRWYGLAYLCGFFIAYLILLRMSKRESLKIPPDAVADLMGWIMIGVLAGGRLGWWIFYHRNVGTPEPWWEPIAIWHGGMSFHGGLVGVILALLLWRWRHGTSFWNLADAAAVVTPIGLFLGRIANFLNGELFGRPTNLPWGVIFPGESFARHPSQIYEAMLEGPVLLLLLWLIRRRNLATGSTMAAFSFFYGCIRFGVEFTRQPDPQLGFIAFGWLTMGQLLSAGLIIAGAVVFIWRQRREAR